MYHDNIKNLTKENTNFREVLHTGKFSQLVVMSLKIGEEIGAETHEETDQMFFVVDGDGEAVVGEETFGFDKDDVIFIPAGTKHNIKNVGDEDLKLYTIYSPPAHKDGIVHQTKEEAMKEEHY